MLNQRSAGILLHPTSFPSHGGVGDLGPAAYEFIDFLASARQGLWQILPLNPAGIGNSPYSSTSAFAGNILLLSLERLADRGLISHQRVASLDLPEGPVDYPRVNARSCRFCTKPLPRSCAARTANIVRALIASSPPIHGGWKITSYSRHCAFVTSSGAGTPGLTS